MAIPTFDVNPFDDEILADPYPLYAEMRAAGPVVHLASLDTYAITRYDDVRAALKNWKQFASDRGTSHNPGMNAASEDLIISTAPPTHTKFRSEMINRLSMSSVKKVKGDSDALAHNIVGDALQHGSFDAVTQVARPFAAEFASGFFGVPSHLVEKFVDGSTAAFIAQGPPGPKADAALGVIGEVLGVISQITKGDLVPGSAGWHLYDAAERGELPEELPAGKLLFNYAAPGFDTTIHAISHAIGLLATHPDQWDKLRSDPSLIRSAAYEVCRYEGPVHLWGRYAPEDVTVDGVTVPGGQRLTLGLMPANRDPDHYPDADRFRIDRDPTDLLSFGHGIHICPGMHLAILELESVLRAFVNHGVQGFEIDGTPELALNNTVRGLNRLNVKVM